MTEDRSQADDAGENRAKSSKKSKLTFSEFLAETARIISTGTPKSAIPSVIKHFRSGYETSPTGDEVSEVVGLVSGWDQAGRLALMLSVETRGKPSSEIMRYVRNRLYQNASDIASYPPSETQGVASDPESRCKAIRDWIALLTKAGDDPGDGHYRIANETAIVALTCLLEEPTSIARMMGIYEILEGCSTKKDGKQEETGEELDDLSLLSSEIGKLVGGEKVNVQGIVSALKVAAPARMVVEKLRHDLHKVKMAHRTEGDRARELALEVESLKGKLAAADGRIESMGQEMGVKDARLVESQTQYENLEHHWEETSRQRLAKQANSIRSELAHEIREARLSLVEGLTLDVPMALERISRMEKALSRLKDEP